MIKIISIFFLVIYVLSALVQFNDPDSARWIAIYLVAAAMCLTQVIGAQPRWLPLSLLVISCIWIALLLPGIAGQVSFEELMESLSMRTQEIEEAREIGGLLLVVLWSAVLALNPETAH